MVKNNVCTTLASVHLSILNQKVPHPPNHF